MAVKADENKRLSNSKKKFPPAILNMLPLECTKLLFTELEPDKNYEQSAIIGKICNLYPAGKRLGGFIRKLLVTDALDDKNENKMKLTVFLLDKFAQDSEAAEPEGFIIINNFIVERSTCQNAADLFPFQVLVKNENSLVWFGRKISRPSKDNVNGNKETSKKKVRSTDEGSETDAITSKKNVTSVNKGSERGAPKKKKQKSNADEAPVILSNQYEYTNIADLHESEEKEMFNIYGIVDKCDLKVTQGRKTQILDLCLTDKTEVGFTCSVFAAKDEHFPDVYPGDIIRIHRMQVYKFRAKLKGKCLSSKFILVFSKSNNGTKPKTVAKSFTFTPEDEEKVKEMFEWNQKQSEPMLISEISKDDFMNIICQVIGVYIAKTTEAVILKIWDGTRTNLFPGTHFGFREEKLDQRLFNIARNYYVVLSVYGNYIGVAAELQPGQYIEVLDAHLYSPKDNPDDCKLCLHAGNKDRRGINVLNDEDEKLVNLKERLGKIISDSEFGNQTDDLLSENNSIFLNCDISAFTPSQKSSKIAQNTITSSQNESADNPSTSNQNEGNLDEDVELLNQPLISKHEKMESTQSIVSVVDAAIQPGQSTQEFGAGMQRESQSVKQSDSNRMSETSEPDALINMTPVDRRYFFHDPVNLGSQIMSPTFPPFVDGTQEEWWQSISTLSVTDGHRNVKPSSLQEIIQHSVPFKFRTNAAVLDFKPETTDINKLIHLYCPTCFYLTENAEPDLQPCETKHGIPYFYCPECLVKTNDFQVPSKMEYTFLVSLFLDDGSGPGYIEVYLWRKNAVTFFKGITPEQALRDKRTADFIFQMLWKICPNCKPFNSSDAKSNYPVLDCCIFSYSAASRTEYQMFDTLLI